MPRFSIDKKEKESLEIVSFNKASDYKVVKMKNGDVKMLHKIQADKLISSKKAEAVKEAKVKEGVDERTVIDVEEKG